MNTDLEKAKALLSSDGKLTCVLYGGEICHTSTERGVKPLLTLLDGNVPVSGFSAADKVVGRGAAFLYVLLGVKAVYACVISKCALDVFTSYGIDASYDVLVDAIQNRTKDGFCPIESAVRDINSPDAALVAIRAKLRELSNK